MVVGVVPRLRRIATGDDPARAAGTRTRGVDGVFAVVATRTLWQLLFAVAEGAAVLAVREWTTALDQGDGLPGFGGNWDALSDNLRDLQWLPANGYALFLADVDTLRASTQKDFDTLLDVMDEASRDWVGRDVPFWVFLSQSA